MSTPESDTTTTKLVATLRDTGDVMVRALNDAGKAIYDIAKAALRVREKEFKLLEEKGVKL